MKRHLESGETLTGAKDEDRKVIQAREGETKTRRGARQGGATQPVVRQTEQHRPRDTSAEIIN